MAGADVAAVGVRATPAEGTAVDHLHRPAGARQVVGAGGADDAAADDDHLAAARAHARMPPANGSAGSTSSVASAVMCAAPVIVGKMTPSATSTVPVKTLPTMLSCRHGCPGRNLPSSYRQASLALVPVPHGERSYA